MKIQALTLALAALALLSTTAANARGTYYIGGQDNVLTYPAVIDGTTAIGTSAIGACGAISASPLDCSPLFGRHTFYDNGMKYRARNRGLLGLGGGLLGLGGGLLGLGRSGYDQMGVTNFAAVVPDACGVASAQQVCGQRLGNSLFALRLFGFGLGFGKVNPRWDARPAGLRL